MKPQRKQAQEWLTQTFCLLFVTLFLNCSMESCKLESPCCKEEEEEAWAYHECREEPEEQIAVVLLVDSEVAGITLDVGTRQTSYQTQFPGWNKRWLNGISRDHYKKTTAGAVLWQYSVMWVQYTFIYGPLLHVRSEKKRRPGIDAIQAADAVRFSAEKRRAAPRMRGVQTGPE